MDKFVYTILKFIITVLAPAVLGWSFMSYHNYSLFGVVVGSLMALFLFGMFLNGRLNK